jgi:hypothetical protein
LVEHTTVVVYISYRVVGGSIPPIRIVGSREPRFVSKRHSLCESPTTPPYHIILSFAHPSFIYHTSTHPSFAHQPSSIYHTSPRPSLIPHPSVTHPLVRRLGAEPQVSVRITVSTLALHAKNLGSIPRQRIFII